MSKNFATSSSLNHNHSTPSFRTCPPTGALRGRPDERVAPHRRTNPAAPGLIPHCASYHSSLEHFVGSGEESGWHGDVECFGSPEVDRQIEPRRLLDGQLSRIAAAENAIHVACKRSIEFSHVRPVREEQSFLCKGRPARNGRQLRFSGEPGQPIADLVHGRIRKDYKYATAENSLELFHATPHGSFEPAQDASFPPFAGAKPSCN
jgi:hypothetical protein